MAPLERQCSWCGHRWGGAHGRARSVRHRRGPAMRANCGRGPCCSPWWPLCWTGVMGCNANQCQTGCAWGSGRWVLLLPAASSPPLSALSACEPEESGTVRRQTVFTHSPTFCTRLCGQCCFMPVRKSSKNCAAFVPVCGRPAASIWAVVAVLACRGIDRWQKSFQGLCCTVMNTLALHRSSFSFQPLARGNGRAPVRGSHDFYHTV